jgi:hypothetical protein
VEVLATGICLGALLKCIVFASVAYANLEEVYRTIYISELPLKNGKQPSSDEMQSGRRMAPPLSRPAATRFP